MKEGCDGHGQPLETGFNFSNNALKAVNTLYGLCMGVIADGRVDDNEILFLDVWLKDNKDYIGSYPLNVVSDRLNDVLQDGVITDTERADLHAMLADLIGGTPQLTGGAGGNSTALPLDKVSAINFEESIFCFTGKFIRGQRCICEQLVKDRGAIISKGITKKVDFLVIGDLASRDWVAAGHGRKIEKALFYRENGSDIVILSECDWVSFMV